MRHDLELALQDRASMQEAISQLPSLMQSEAQCQQEIADLRDDNESLSIELDAVRADLEHLKGLQFVQGVLAPGEGGFRGGDISAVGTDGGAERHVHESALDGLELITAAGPEQGVALIQSGHSASLALIAAGRLVDGGAE
jgi:hypothetical protein